MKTVESNTKVRHLARNESEVSICGLLRRGSWTIVAADAALFIQSSRLRQCEKCEARIVRLIEQAG